MGEITPGQVLWVVVFSAVLIWSAIRPHDYPTWILEVGPAILAAAVLGFTRNRYPLTTLTCILILIHCVILMIGGHYTYAEVPLFDRLSEWFEGGRNNYDKLGHFAQGFVPAMVTREILLRNQVINGDRWRAFFVVCFCLAFSAFYELIVWWVAILSAQGAEAFLGTQGYIWDTQSDMLWALTGAVAALATLSRWQERQMSRFNWPGLPAR